VAQLIDCFQRAASSEQHQARAITDDELFRRFADVMAKSIHISEDDDDQGGDDDEPAPLEVSKVFNVSNFNFMNQNTLKLKILIQEQELEKQTLLSEQLRLLERGAAMMVLVYLSACQGEPGETVARTLQLGIHLLSGGNVQVQAAMLRHLQEQHDVRFFTSMSGFMSRCRYFSAYDVIYIRFVTILKHHRSS